jgi:predicted ATP-dependent endonuclease of OLD family
MYISSLRLSGNELDNYSYEAEQSGDRQLLSSLSKVNFIVGPNNSGKSRLLRKIFSSQKISFQPVASLTSVSEIRKDIITGIETILNGSQNISDLKEQSQALPDIRIMTESTDAMKALGDIAHTLSTVGSAGTYTHTNMLNLSRSLEQLNLLGDSIKTRLESAGKALLNNTTFSKFYIPTLRSLRFIDAPNIPDIFLETTKRDYFSQGHQTIFSGLKLRSEMEEMRLGDREQRLALDKFEKYLGNSFFGGRDIQLIPKYNSRTLHIKIGNEDQFASEHLGDGIQMVIILTFLLFKDPKQQKLIFIEEPELFLHPGMQRMVLEKFLSSTNTQFFIATHSNHLLDMTLDDKNISIFTSTKDLTSEGDIAKAKFTIRNVSRSDRQTLDLLGIRNSSVALLKSLATPESPND